MIALLKAVFWKQKRKRHYLVQLEAEALLKDWVEAEAEAIFNSDIKLEAEAEAVLFVFNETGSGSGPVQCYRRTW